MMAIDIKSKIYQARCIGNVEPIEYMIPYPSMRSLIEGQNIKYADQVIKIAMTKELKPTEWVEVDISKKDDKSQASIQ